MTLHSVVRMSLLCYSVGNFNDTDLWFDIRRKEVDKNIYAVCVSSIREK